MYVVSLITVMNTEQIEHVSFANFAVRVHVRVQDLKFSTYSRVRNKRPWTLKLVFFLLKIPPWMPLLEAFLLHKCLGRLLISRYPRVPMNSRSLSYNLSEVTTAKIKKRQELFNFKSHETTAFRGGQKSCHLHIFASC